MTNQEAIKILREKVFPCLITGEWTEAIGMAIAALKAQDAPDINVGTSKYTVSATAVEEMLKDLLPERGMWEIEGDEAKTAICETVHDALEGLWKLPSAQPEQCSDCIANGGDWECDHMHCRKGRLPSAQPDLTAEEWNLVKKLRSCHNGSYAHVLDKLIAAASQPEQLGNLWKSAFESGRTYEKEEIVHFLDEIKEQLGYEQPEIIHCCDCKYSSKDMIFDEYFCSKKTRSNCVAEDHYCGYAKRWEE